MRLKFNYFIILTKYVTYEKNFNMEIVWLNEFYKFSVGHLLTGYIFYVLILNIKNQKFHCLTKIYQIQYKR